MRCRKKGLIVYKMNDLNKDYLKEVIKLKKELKKYKEGFNILIEYFDYLPEEEKGQIDIKLNKIDL